MKSQINHIGYASHRFNNGVTVINCTPHPLSFLSPEGEKITVPCSDPLPGEKKGCLVIDAATKEVQVSRLLVKTEFVPSEAGINILDQVDQYKETLPEADRENVMVVGSIIAMNAYPGKVVGMTPAPGFERVAPADKLMRCDKFNTAE